jgi:DNA-binding NarL/FixJ family response regulator
MGSQTSDGAPIRVLIVDDHTVVRKGLNALLSTPRFNIEVVGEAADGIEAIQNVDTFTPDVILLDLVMPRKGGLEVIRELRENGSDVRILILSSFSEDDDIVEAIRAGAEGYLMKDCSPDELVHAIRSVHSGQFTLPGEIARKVMLVGEQDDQLSGEQELTLRETDVLICMAQGLSNQDIAEALGISPYTVRSHVRNILRKLDVKNRTQAVLIAIERGLTPSS